MSFNNSRSSRQYKYDGELTVNVDRLIEHIGMEKSEYKTFYNGKAIEFKYQVQEYNPYVKIAMGFQNMTDGATLIKTNLDIPWSEYLNNEIQLEHSKGLLLSARPVLNSKASRNRGKHTGRVWILEVS